MERIELQKSAEEKKELREDIDAIGRLLEWQKDFSLWREEKATIEERKLEEERIKNNKYRNNWFNQAFGIMQFYPEFEPEVAELMDEFEIHRNKYQDRSKEELKSDQIYIQERSVLIDKTDKLLIKVRKKLIEKLK